MVTIGDRVVFNSVYVNYFTQYSEKVKKQGIAGIISDLYEPQPFVWVPMYGSKTDEDIVVKPGMVGTVVAHAHEMFPDQMKKPWATRGIPLYVVNIDNRIYISSDHLFSVL